LTSILEIIGECNGKILSTPIPLEIFLTVNVASKLFPALLPITTPSNSELVLYCLHEPKHLQ